MNPDSLYPNPRDIRRCSGSTCGAEIVFMKTKAGKRIPVNVYPQRKTSADKWRSPYDGETEYVHGEHQPHHFTCPDVEEFR